METAIIDTTQVRAFGGGEATGPSPVDRRKKGTKYTLLVDREGVPLVIRAVPANRSDQLEILPTVVSFPSVGGKPGRPRTHPQKRIQRDLERLVSSLVAWGVVTQLNRLLVGQSRLVPATA